ncbi:MAG TPA: hypothetical protein QF520_06965, partial [SAR202 cluster bacterium]|nr:hypothetical protein [SAR202 cluster bacterium]
RLVSQKYPWTDGGQQVHIVDVALIAGILDGEVDNEISGRKFRVRSELVNLCRLACALKPAM